MIQAAHSQPRRMTPPQHPVPTFREALDRARPTLQELAHAIGVEPGTLAQYHAGARVPPSYVRRRLAAYLRIHAADMGAIADRLEAENAADD